MQNVLNKYNIDIINQNGMLLVEARAIGKLININNIRTSIFSQDEKCLLKVQTNGGMQYKNYLTEKGFFKLICLSRKPIAVKIATELDLYVKHKYVPSEISFINNIQSAFYGETMICQYLVDKFRIDLYFPDYNLAVEFDEAIHKSNQKKDKIRQDYISNKIDCKFIRIKEDKDIFESINKIRMFLKSKDVKEILTRKKK